MSFLKRIFATAAPTQQPRQSSRPSPEFSVSLPESHSQNLLAQQNASRRELLRLVLRDTLNRTGIPTSWVGADLLAATSRGREPGIHIRLLLKHWDPRLLLHGTAFENSFKKRVLALDPLADRWLLGISWQFSLADDSNCPPMPHPRSWTSSVPAAVFVAAAGAQDAAMNSFDAADPLGSSIVISGPATAPDSSAARPAAAAAQARAEAKADLDRLFAVRDQDLKRHSETADPSPSFAATEPAGLDVLTAVSAYSPNESTDSTELQNSFAKTDIFKRPSPSSAPR